MRLGLKGDLLGNPGLLTTLTILGPALGQVKLPGHRQTAPLTGQRHAHGHLTIVLLTQLTAVLPGNTHGMFAFLRKPRVIDDPPAASLKVHLRHHPLCNAPEHLTVRPLRPGHEVVQRLMPGAHVSRIKVCSHRLDALSGQRLHQSGTVSPEPFVPVPMPEPLGQVFQVRVEPLCCVHLATPLLNCSYVILTLHL